MIALLFGAAFMFLSPPGRMARPTDLPADSPLGGAEAEASPSATKQKTDPSQKAATHGANASDPKQSPRADDQTQRTRELIYFFRSYRVFMPRRAMGANDPRAGDDRQGRCARAGR